MQLKKDYNLEQSGIYKISINDKIYIGSAQNFKNRIYKHEYRLKKNTHVNKHLQNLYNKYGSGSFKFEILEIVDINNLLIREQFYLDTLANLINQSSFATNPTYKRLFSEEDIFKMAELYNSNYSLYEICDFFKLKYTYSSQISRIANGKIYTKYKELFNKRKNIIKYKPSQKTKDLIGSKNRKLSDKDVTNIRVKYGEGISQIQLSKNYDVSYTTINKIVNYKLNYGL